MYRLRWCKRACLLEPGWPECGWQPHHDCVPAAGLALASESRCGGEPD